MLNRTLDENGGVCVKSGRQCGTSISNNIAPDEVITSGLQGLNSSAKKLVKNTEIDDSSFYPHGTMSGKWKGIMIPGLVSLIITIEILILIESCNHLCQELFNSY